MWLETLTASPGLAQASYSWEGTIIFWSGETGQPLHSVKCDQGPLSIVFSHDATLLAATFSNGTFIVKLGTVMRHFSGHDDYVRGAAFSRGVTPTVRHRLRRRRR
jgi:WD40 repeat protein